MSRELRTFEVFLRLLGRLIDLPRRAKQIVVGVVDLALLMAATWIAFSLRLDEWSIWTRPVIIMFLISSPLALITFYLGGVYRTIFRYAGVGMLTTIAWAFLFYASAVFVIFTLYGLPKIPRTLGILQPVIFFLLVCSIRIIARYVITDILGRGRYAGTVRRALIYGAGQAGQQLLASIRSDPSVKIVAYLDDDERIVGQRLDGVRVYSLDSIPDLKARFNVSDIFLAVPGLSRRRQRKFVAEHASKDLTVSILPRMRDVVEGRIQISELRPIEVEDLLGREMISPDEKLLHRTILERTVMVSGAGGSIGSELCRQIQAIGAHRLVLYEISEFALYAIQAELLNNKNNGSGGSCEIVPILGSVTDELLIEEVFRDFHVDTVFHAAAYKHVPLVEANPIEGIRNNVLGTQRLALAARAGGVKDFVLISTDKAVRPTNVMGATKRLAEQIVQALAAQGGLTCFSMVRFGNVLGSSGSVVPLFRQQIENGGPITLTDRNITRYFMTIPEAANLVIQAGGMAKGGEVFVLDMGRPIKISELAKTMVALSGLSVRDDKHPEGDIEIVEGGLRPGEKMYEELLIGNDPLPTQHKRIFKGQEGFEDWSVLESAIRELELSRDLKKALSILNRTVPDFCHQRDN